MIKFAAHDAKARFGTLIDAARREPVTIERHGRAVAVIISKEEFDEIEAMRLEHLRAEVQKGLEASDQSDVIDVDEDDLEAFVDTIMIGADNSVSTR